MAELPKIVLQEQTNTLSRPKLLLLFLGLQTALFISFIDSTSVSTVLPIIARDLDAADSITWAGTAFLVANTSFQVITSRLSDCLGRKVVLLGSLALFGFGDLIAGFAKNAVWLYCGRAVAGIGGGGINSLSMIIVSDVVTVRERGKYLTLLGIGIAGGSGVGPFIGALLAEKAKWNWVFWMMAPMAALTMALIQFTLPQKPLTGNLKEKLQHMDWLGSLLSLTMIVCILVPLSGGGSTFAWQSPVVVTLFIVGGLALAAFVWVEAKVARLPLIPGRLLKNRNIALLLFQTWLVGMVFYGGIYFTPLYLQNVLEYDAITSAALLLPLVLSQVLTTTISGFVVKYTNRTWSSFFFGFVLWTAGQGAQLCFGPDTHKGVVVGVLLLQGLGIGSTIQSTLVLAQVSGPNSDRAAVTGVRNFARTSGGAIGLAMSNVILQNVFIQRLPTDLPTDLREYLQKSFDIPQSIDQGVERGIRLAYMAGLKNVFILFVPVVGVCLLLCFLVKDLPLETPKKPDVEELADSPAESTISVDAVTLPSDGREAFLDADKEKTNS